MEQIQALAEVQVSLLMLLDSHQEALVSDQDLLVTTSRYGFLKLSEYAFTGLSACSLQRIK